MKIYHISWYNEDDYGPMDGLYVIVQAEGEQEALEFSKTHLKEMYNRTIEDLEESYEKYEVKDITDSPVISSGTMGF